ncbi:MAG: alpha/beta hydrolase [Candidatus Binatia bacterium]|nr:alpha/beta hydrolase [Candidatus Binatia bacterium]
MLVIDPAQRGRAPAPSVRFTLEAAAVHPWGTDGLLACPRVIVFGNLRAGMAATRLAIAQPERFVGLVLMDSPFHEWGGVERFNARMGYRSVATLAPRHMANVIFSNLVGPEARAAAPGRYLRVQCTMRTAECTGFGRCAASAAFNRPEPALSLHLVRTHTLGISGDCDRIYPIDEVRTEAAHIPGASRSSRERLTCPGGNRWGVSTR